MTTTITPKKNFVTICCSCCKAYLQDDGTWGDQSPVMSDDCVISHGLCPKCIIIKYPQYARTNKEDPAAEK